jgi:hypothetical protein
MAAPSPDPWVTAFGGFLTAGGLKFVYDMIKSWRDHPPAVRDAAVVDLNISAVARARDELIEDNLRLREERLEQDARHAAERQQWLDEKGRLRADVARLETELRAERAASILREQEAQKRYDSLLVQVQHLGRRTNRMEDRNG